MSEPRKRKREKSTCHVSHFSALFDIRNLSFAPRHALGNHRMCSTHRFAKRLAAMRVRSLTSPNHYNVTLGKDRLIRLPASCTGRAANKPGQFLSRLGFSLLSPGRAISMCCPHSSHRSESAPDAIKPITELGLCLSYFSLKNE